MKWITFALFLLSQSVYGSLLQRQHSDTIIADHKILASDLNDEFNAIVTSVNSIDATNVTAGSLTASHFAATSSAYVANRRIGCLMEPVAANPGNQSIYIRTPCEIVMDGLRYVLAATASISLTGNHDATLKPAFYTYYFVYASANGTQPSFGFSQIIPNLSTLRKTGDTSARYIGTVRTTDTAQDINTFYQVGPNMFTWQSGFATTNLTFTPTQVAGNYTLDIPAHFNSLQLKSIIQTAPGVAPVNCEFLLDGGVFRHQHFATANQASDTLVMPFWYPISASGTVQSASYINRSFCPTTSNIRVQGWTENPTLFQ